METLSFHLALRNVDYYSLSALVTMESKSLLSLKPTLIPRFTCVFLLSLKENKQESRKRIQAKILGVSTGYEQSP